MSEKGYPNAVVLKRNLVVMVGLSVLLIMLLIIRNLYYSNNKSNTQVAVQTNEKLTVTASEEDVRWLQVRSGAKETPIISKPEPVQVSPEPISSNAKNEKVVQEEIVRQVNENKLAAMSAAITSNQLTANETQTPNQNEISTIKNDKNNQLDAVVKNPVSPFELQAGTIIPGVLITGINSDLPGQITGQVRSNVYDSITGKYLLVPQGAKLVGLYESKIAYGQKRVLIAWHRILFPNGKSMDLQGMPGADLSGYSGFNDLVDNHYFKIFGSVILVSALGAGAQLSQPQTNQSPVAAPNVGQTLAQITGTNLANMGMAMTEKNLNIQPTLEIRPGYLFNIAVAKDLVFAGPYEG